MKLIKLLIILSLFSSNVFAFGGGGGGISNPFDGGSISGETTFDEGIIIPDDKNASHGDDSDAQFQWDTAQTNDAFLLGLSGSRNFIICEKADMGVDFGRGNSSDPALIIQSADHTSLMDYAKHWHDQSNYNIATGDGGIVFTPASNSMFIKDGSDTTFRIRSETTTDQTIFGLYDASGNQLILTNSANVATDHGITPQTNPYLAVFDDNATNHVGIYQDQTDANVFTNSGAIILTEGGGAKDKLFSISLADDATTTLPTSTTGTLEIFVEGDNENATCHIQDNGTVTIPVSTGSVLTTDTDANLCIITGANPVVIRNRLGATKTIICKYTYK